jgi:hypothetical protein
VDNSPPTAVALVGGQQLVVEDLPAANVLKLLSADGRLTLSIRVTPAGPVLHLEGAGLMIQTDGDLAVSAGRVAIHARDGLALTSGGDAHIHAAGDLHSTARIQNLTADLGNVNVKANDDIKLNGERVLVNC